MKAKLTFIEIAWRLLLLLFLYTALDKLFNFNDFTGKINNQPFDNKFTPILIYAIPGIELLTCVLLLPHKTRFLGFLCSAALMLVFTIYVAMVTFHFYDRVPCSCSGIHAKLTWPQHLAINIVFLLISIWAAYFIKTTSKQPSDHSKFRHSMA